MKNKIVIISVLSLLPALLLAACGAKSVDLPGSYHAMLPSDNSAGWNITMTLNADNTVTVSNDYLNGEAPLIDTGTWQSKGDKIIVTLKERDGAPRDRLELTFELQDDTLVAVALDPPELSAYAGLRLRKN